MQPLFKAARWGAAGLLLVAGGCVKVETQSAPSRFQCPSGKVPVAKSGGWDCAAPNSLGMTARIATQAGTASDAGVADFATHALSAASADGFSGTDATLQVGTSNPTDPVEIDGTFHIQGFAVPASRPLESIPAFNVDGTDPDQEVYVTAVNDPSGSMVHFRIVGRIFASFVGTTASDGPRCDLSVDDGSTPLGTLNVSVPQFYPSQANSNGTTIDLERTVSASVPSLHVHVHSRDANYACFARDGDLKLLVEVLR